MELNIVILLLIGVCRLSEARILRRRESSSDVDSGTTSSSSLQQRKSSWHELKSSNDAFEHRILSGYVQQAQNSAFIGGARCQTADSREGICYTSSECEQKSGVPIGRCGRGAGVCCAFDATCGSTVSERTVYFRTPDYPRPLTESGVCRLRLNTALDGQSTCQLRISFDEFHIAPPNGGNCTQDVFFISGQNENNILPRICGYNRGQHYYINVDESGQVNLHFLFRSFFERRFAIHVEQIECESNRIAPNHCLQYFPSEEGVIESFNFNNLSTQALSNHQDGYPNNLDYVVCIRKEPGFCSISYSIAQSNSTGVPYPFEVGAMIDGNSSRLSVKTICPNDYLAFSGMRICSAESSMNSSISSTEGASIQRFSHSNRQMRRRFSSKEISTKSIGLIDDTTNGPFQMRFVSDSFNNGRGFHLNFKQNPCTF